MKKSDRLRIAALLLLLFILLGWLITRGAIVFDNSARRVGEGFVWNDVMYVGTAADYHEGGTIAKTDDGWRINAVKEDKEHRFLVIRSFLDQYLCVREDYVIPSSGTLNAVFLDGEKENSPELCVAITAILADFNADEEYKKESIVRDTDTQQLRNISFCYEDCPVGIDREDCHIGCLDGKWVFAKRSPESLKEYGEVFTYDIYNIPDEYISVIEKYCGEE